jgi:hypothetical protein
MRTEHTQGYYEGCVTAVGPHWVELKAGWSGSENDAINWLGQNKSAKRFSAIGTISGGNPKGDGKDETYGLKDLKIGDVIRLRTGISRDKSDEWTTQILLRRRPGGKVPPLPGTVDGVDGIWHKRMQAEQDWEEKGTPIPNQFLSDGRNTSTKPPYPPTAPPPRVRSDGG